MSEQSESAKELFKKGYNCAQSVVSAFCDEIGLDLETALKISSSFGGGMGRLREVCGAVTGMFMVIGLKYGYIDPKDKDVKADHYKLIQSLAKSFEEENGSIICRDLLGLSVTKDSPAPEDRNTSYYQKRPCAELVGHAAEILEAYIQNRKTEERDMGSVEHQNHDECGE